MGSCCSKKPLNEPETVGNFTEADQKVLLTSKTNFQTSRVSAEALEEKIKSLLTDSGEEIAYISIAGKSRRVFLSHNDFSQLPQAMKADCHPVSRFLAVMKEKSYESESTVNNIKKVFSNFQSATKESLDCMEKIAVNTTQDQFFGGSQAFVRNVFFGENMSDEQLKEAIHEASRSLSKSQQFYPDTIWPNEYLEKNAEFNMHFDKFIIELAGAMEPISSRKAPGKLTLVHQTKGQLSSPMAQFGKGLTRSPVHNFYGVLLENGEIQCRSHSDEVVWKSSVAPGHPLNTLEMSPNGQVIAVGLASNNMMEFFAVQNGALLKKIPTSFSAMRTGAVEMSRLVWIDDQRVAVGFSNSFVSIYDVASENQLHTQKMDDICPMGIISAMATGSNGNLLIGGGSGALILLNSSLSVITSNQRAHSNVVLSLKFNQNENMFASGSEDEFVKGISEVNGRLVIDWEVKLAAGVIDVAFDWTGEIIGATTSNGDDKKELVALRSTSGRIFAYEEINKTINSIEGVTGCPQMFVYSSKEEREISKIALMFS